ncbi:TolC family protein [Pontibacter sp. E15-1]|uniref:TolC family protein n=1 Tax=Pontibacter sp. E15-1 TaxID=2919918 RepID=UPI001F4F3960|nr:TolC family protein [Pontibacter sp. E15-1]MCJ8164368.1 TolC family protein [Pontibacter sp. E15-1]
MRQRTIASVLLSALLFSGCVRTSSFDRTYVGQKIAAQRHGAVGEQAEPGLLLLPEGVNLQDGLTQQEAVSIALFNNAQFQADLLSISIAQADLIEAGQLPNPLLNVIFPTGTDVLKGTLNFSLDVLWQRPLRVKASRLETERTAENLVALGLRLIRDVKLAYVAYTYAQQRAGVGAESSRLRSEMASITRKRYNAGDLSQMEASIATADSLRALDDQLQFVMEESLQGARLYNLMGIDSAGNALKLAPIPPPAPLIPQLDTLMPLALASRPELRVAALAIEAKAKLIGWEKAKVLNFVGILNARREHEGGLALGPGFQLPVPVFNLNRGRIMRARAEMEQAAYSYVVAKQQVQLEVQEALARYQAARQTAALWQQNQAPVLATAGQARKAFEAGEVSYFFYLQTVLQVTDVQLRIVDATAALNRAAVQLNYAIGQQVIY